MKQKILSLLALLMTAATGAWAQEETLLTTITMGGEPWSLQPVYTESGRATLSTSGTVEEGMVCPEINGWSNSSPSEIGSVTITAAEGYTITKVVFWDYDMMEGYRNALTDNASPFTCYLKSSQRSLNENMSSPNGYAIAKIEVYGYAATVAVTGVTLSPTTSSLTAGGAALELTPTVAPAGATDKTVKWSVTQEGSIVDLYTDEACTQAVGANAIAAAKVYVKPLAAGQATVTVTTNDGAKTATCTVTVADPNAVKVTTNKAENETTFTEASFEMPASDVTIDYELVRDMSVQMQAQVGDDATKEPRYRVQWNGENWVPADMTQQQVAALFSVNDLIEEETLAPKSYFVSIYAVNEQGETTGDPMTFLNFTFAPGRYAVKASAMLDSPTYDGTTELSNTFELFQGYEVEIAANSYATYYKDEALTIDESTAEDAALYTISEVTATEAVLSSKIEAAPSSTPLLIFNSSDKARTILLIPTNEPNLALTVAPEFKGTATAKDFSADDMATANFYVLTDAKAFVWVKGAGQIAANKCWLEIEKTAPNNTRAIVFGEDATSINEELRVKNEESAGAVFDLSGRKVANGKWLNGKLPNGVYIINGKKMVVK